MNIEAWLGPWAYVFVAGAAAIEGEAVFIAAAALVASGQLDAVAVCVAGAVGAAAGDQFYFYALRRHLGRLLDVLPAGRRRQALAATVRAHESLAIIAVRFTPGLRVALTALCVDAGVSGWRFSVLNTVSAVVWALALMGLIAYAGPQAFGALGLPAWAASLAPAFMLLGVIALVAHIVQRGWREREEVGVDGRG